MKKLIISAMMGMAVIVSTTSFAAPKEQNILPEDTLTTLQTTAISPAASYIYSLGNTGDSVVLIALLEETKKTNALLQKMLNPFPDVPNA